MLSNFSEQRFRDFFQTVTGRPALDFQTETCRYVLGGKSVALRVPTGSGKNMGSVVPFFYPDWRNRPNRLIYALPLRTLAHGVYYEARKLAARLGHSIDGELAIARILSAVRAALSGPTRNIRWVCSLVRVLR